MSIFSRLAQFRKKSPVQVSPPRAHQIALEPRMMFDGAAVAAAAEALDAADALHRDSTAAGSDLAADRDAAQLLVRLADAATPLAGVRATEARTEVVFVDAGVEDVQTLLAGIDQQVEVVLLDPARDGVDQITRVLSQFDRPVDTVHIIAHGEAGVLKLGTATLDSASLNGRYAADMASLRDSLSPQADMLIYGCDVAGSAAGRLFVDQLAQVTGADVAASTNATGDAAQGGDWILEDRTGAIDAPLFSISPEAQERWHHLLAVNISSGTSATGLVNTLTEGGRGIAVTPGSESISGGGGVFAGTFTTSGSSLGVAQGIVLGTGDLAGVTGGQGAAYTGGGQGAFWNSAGSGVSNGIEYDQVQLQFTFVAQTGKISLSAVFGSEEYYEYVNSGYNDNYSVLLTGPKPGGGTYTDANIAVVPGTAATEVSIDTINNTVNPAFNRDNTVASAPVQDLALDGITTRLDTVFSVTPGATYTVRFQLADVADAAYDSAAFIQYFGGSLVLDLDQDNSTAAGAGSASNFTEGGASVPVVDTDVSVTNYDTATDVQSATVRLTNAQAGDELSAAGLPVGITAQVDTSVAGQITLTLSGAASEAAYETALKAVRFQNTSEAPDTTQRTIEVSVNDGATSSNVAISRVNVTAVNDAPTLAGSAAPTYIENQAPVIIDASLVVGDVDSPTLSSALVTITNHVSGQDVLALSADAATMGNITASYDSFSGMLSLTSAGNTATLAEWQAALRAVTYVNTSDAPDPTTRQIAFQINDGHSGNSASNTVISLVGVVPVNDVPLAVDDSATLAEDTTVTGNVITTGPGADSDRDGDALQVTRFTLAGDATVYSPGQTATLPGVGTLRIDGDGSYTFTPAPNYNGAVPVATCTVSDGQGGVASATLTLAVTAVNDLPTLRPDTGSTPEDNTLTVPASAGVLSNDLDLDGDPLVVTSFTYAGQPSTWAAGSTAIMPGVGTLRVNADGSYVFTPQPNYNGAVPVVTCTVSDGRATAQATLTLSVSSVPDGPLAQDDIISPAEDSTATGSLFSNDSDADGDPLSLAGFTVAGDATVYAPGSTATLPGIGTLTIATSGAYSFVPVSNYNGAVPDVTYTVTDGTQTGSARLSIAVVPVNDAPVARVDTASTQEDTPVIIDVLANDSDVDGSTLTVTSASAPFGSVTIQPDGTLLYTPLANRSGNDTISYAISDGQGGTSSARVSVTVAAVNDAPTEVVPGDQSLTEDTFLVLTTASGNAPSVADVDGGILTATVSAGHGTLTLSGQAGITVTGEGTGTVTMTGQSGAINAALNGLRYQPDADWYGPDSLTLVTNDNGNTGLGGPLSVSKSVLLTTVGVADISDDTAATNEDTAVSLDVLANDRFSNPTAAISAITQGAHGQVTQGTGGVLTYTPDANWHGTDSFTYTVSAGGAVETATVTVTVASVDDAPTSTAMPDAVNSDAQAIAVNAAAFFDDADFAFDAEVLTYTATGLPPGLAIDAATGRIGGTLASDASQSGPYTVTVTATDHTGLSSAQTFTWTVLNPSPVAAADAAAGDEDTAVVVNVLANDSDPDGDALQVVSASAGHGTVTIRPDGQLSLQPDANWNGIDVISYTVSDGQGGSSTAQVTVTIQAVEDAPYILAPAGDLAGDDSSTQTLDVAALFGDVDGDTLTYTATGLPPGLAIDRATSVISGTLASSASAGSPYSVVVSADDGQGGQVEQRFTWTVRNPAPIAADDSISGQEDTALNGEVLSNDSDPDGDALTVLTTPAQAPAHGALVVNADGTFRYTPDADWNGTDHFSYQLRDADGALSTATVTLQIAAVEDAPVTTAALADQAGADGTPVLFNASTVFADADGDVLSFSATGLPAGLGIDAATGMISGTIDHAASAAGPYLVTVTADDGHGGTTSASLRWLVTNPAPTALADSATGAEDTALTGDVLANDSDIDGDTLRVVTTPLQAPQHGQLALGADGRFSYTPDANWNGTDQFTYQLVDGDGATSTATVTLQVSAVQDAPLAVGGVAAQSASDGDPVRLSIAAAFTEVDDEALTYSATGLPPGLGLDATTGLITGRLDASASLGGRYSVTLTATDPLGATATQRFDWTVINPAPVAHADTATTAEDTPVTVDVLANDTDRDGDALAVTAATADHGTVAVLPDGTLRYTPAANFNGSDVVTYVISDGQGGSATATVAVTVTPVNDVPTLVSGQPDQVSMDGQATWLPVAGLFADADLTPLAFGATGLPPGLTIDAATGVISGTVAGDASVGGPYTVTLLADDGQGGTVSTRFTWVVNNTTPVAADSALTTAEDTLASTALLAQAHDADSDTLAVTGASARHGQVAVAADGTLSYTPDADFNGLDLVTWTVSDGQGGVASATVSITVTPVNDAPVATASLNDRVSNDGEAVLLDTNQAFSDPDDTALAYTATGLPPGLAMDPATGRITGRLAADASANGPYAVTMTVADSQGASVSRSFSWVVLNPVPLAGADAASGAEDTALTGQLLDNDTDPDGDALSVVTTPATAPAHGSVVLQADGHFSYTPDAHWSGTDRFTYTLRDAQGAESTATVVLSVAAVNDAPVAPTSLGTLQGVDGQPVQLDTAASFSDAEGDTLSHSASGLPAGLSIDPASGVISGTLDRHASVGGPYAIEVTATDGQGGTARSTLTLAVTNPPVRANDDTFALSGQLASGQLLANDFDADGDALTVSTVPAQAPRHGRLTLHEDGTFLYTAWPDFSGADQFSYSVRDADGAESTATVTITADPTPNLAPVSTAIGDLSNADGQTLDVDLSPYFTDPEGQPLQFAATGLPAGLTLDAATGHIQGTVDAAASRIGTYLVSLSADDGHGGVTHRDFTWVMSNPAPVAMPDSAATMEDTPLTLAVLGNDHDPDGDTITLTQARADHGRVTVQPDGTLLYQPDRDYNGQDTLTYQITDAQGATASTTVDITVQPVADGPHAATIGTQTHADGQTVALNLGSFFTDPDGLALTFSAHGLPTGLSIDPATGVVSGTLDAAASTAAPWTVTLTAADGQGHSVASSFLWQVTNPAPVLLPDTASTSAATPVTLALLANDTDPDGDAMRITAAVAGHGRATVQADGSVVYLPEPGFSGTDTLVYTVSDGQGGVASSHATITVLPGTTGPLARPIPGQANADGQSVVINLDAFFSDPAGDPITFSASNLPPGLSIDPATGLVSGTVDHTASTAGVYAVTVTATDPTGHAVSSGFDWQIHNPVPVAAPDLATISEDLPLHLDVLANDTDPDGDALRLLDATAGHGVVTLQPDGTLIYQANANWNGTDTLSYRIVDSNGGISSATVLITVVPVADAPLAAVIPTQDNSDGQTVAVNLGAFIGSPDGLALSYAATGLPAGLRIDPATGVVSGTIDRAASDASGGDCLVTLTATDTAGASVTTQFHWALRNTLPEAIDDAATVTEDTAVDIPVLANDTDADGDTLHVISAQAAHGTASVNPDGTVHYVPAPGYSGHDVLIYSISDGQGGVASAAAGISITAVNDSPVAHTLPALSSADGQFVRIDLGAYLADPDGDALRYSATGLPAGLSLDPVTGIVTGAINASASTGGATTVQITADDGHGGTVSASFTWSVDNPAPVATTASVSVSAGTPVTLAVLDHVTDPDGDAMTLSGATAGHGQVTINADGTLTYQPAAGYTGHDTVLCTVTDSDGAHTTATIDITVVSTAEPAPLAGSVPPMQNTEGQAVSLALGGYFSDPQGQALSFTAQGLPPGLQIDPATGLVSGTISTTAATSGPYTVTIGADDGHGGTASITFTWTVTDPAPVARGDVATVSEDTPVTLDVLANDSDPDGDTLHVTTAVAAHGTVTLNSDGTLTYLPAPGFNGQDGITYTVADSQGRTTTATVTVTVTAVNDAPLAGVIPPLVTGTTQPVSIDLSPWFTDPDGDGLTWSAAGLPPGLSLDPATGIVTGTLTPNAFASGPAYPVTLTVTDGHGGTAVRDFVWTVTNDPSAPLARSEQATAIEDTPTTLVVLSNDVDPNGQPLVVASASAGHGQVTINPDGTLSYVPAPDFSGVDTIVYQIRNGQGGQATATVNVTVSQVNDAPVVETIPALTAVDGAPLAHDVSIWFDDVDGDALNYSATGLPAGLAIDPAHGVIWGTIAPGASIAGPAAITVTVDDGHGGTVSQTFTLNVVNPAPVAQNDALTLVEDTPAVIDVRANDTDPDSDALSVYSASAGHGSVSVQPDGTLRYVPAADFNGTDTIVYTLTDGQGGFSSAQVTVTVTPINDLPTARTTPALTLVDGSPVDLHLGDFITDPDQQALTFSATGLPAGLAIDPATGVVSGTLDPSASTHGLYTITVTATDSQGGSVTLPVQLQVHNPAPTPADDSFTVVADQPATLAVLANDTDPDHDPLAIQTATAAHGQVLVNADGTLRYTPDAGFSGTDTVVYTVSDGDGGFATATVQVTVTGVNHAPTAPAALPDLALRDGETVAIEAGRFFTDPDGQPLSFSATGLPPGLSLTPDTGVITGTLQPGSSTDGPFHVTITASDGHGGSVVRDLVLAVSNPTPVAVGDTAVVDENGEVLIDVLANDSDRDGDPLVVLYASAAHGRVDVRPDGQLHYVPDADFNGQDTILYTAADGQGGLSTATVSVDVQPRNSLPVVATTLPPQQLRDGEPVNIDLGRFFSDADGDALHYAAAGLPPGLAIDAATGVIVGTVDTTASTAGPYTVTLTVTDGQGGVITRDLVIGINNPAPLAANDTAVVTDGTPAVLQVLANDIDPDHDTLSVVTAEAGHGSVLIQPDGTLLYTPDAGYRGDDTVLYTISDGQGGFSSAQVRVAVQAANQAPIPSAIMASPVLADGGAVSFELGRYFSDPDGDRLAFSATGLPAGLSVDPTTGALTGTLAADASQGGPYTATLTVSDGHGGSVSRPLAITVTNPEPVASDDGLFTTAFNQPLTLDLLGNDRDPDGDPLAVFAVQAAHGAVMLQADGRVIYQPEAGFSGRDTLLYTITDGNGGRSSASATIDVQPDTARPPVPVDPTPVNHEPTANPDTAVVPVNRTTRIDVLANDTDPDGDALPVVSATAGRGTVLILPDGALSYTPATDFTGTDVILYTISDGHGGHSTTTVAVTIEPNVARVAQTFNDGAGKQPTLVAVEDAPAISDNMPGQVIIRSVEQMQSLNSLQAMGVNGTDKPVIMSTVNRLQSLGGQAAQDYTPRTASLRGEVSDLALNGLGDSISPEAPQRMAMVEMAAERLTEKLGSVFLQAQLRRSALHIRAHSPDLNGRNPVIEYQFRTLDGRPLPAHVRADEHTGRLIVKRVAGQKHIGLTVRALRADGGFSEDQFRVSMANGGVTRVTAATAETTVRAAPVRTLTDALTKAEHRPGTERDRLAAALRQRPH